VVSAADPGYCGIYDSCHLGVDAADTRVATNLNYYHGLKDPRIGCKALIISATGAKEQVHALVVDDHGERLRW
jgi:hypothetical protein